MLNESITLWLWVVDDGEMHWVVASNPDDALTVLAETFDTTIEEIREEGHPSINLADYTKPIRYNLDEYAAYHKIHDGILPERVQIIKEHYALCMPVDIVKMGRGLFATTSY